jgi:hypothetical protein
MEGSASVIQRVNAAIAVSGFGLRCEVRVVEK